ncbi:MAG: peptidylprolyl isomerase [Armatimonadota bacterium]|nr:peptidylprolyl isomerase [Armatimonadota bacterium]
MSLKTIWWLLHALALALVACQPQTTEQTSGTEHSAQTAQTAENQQPQVAYVKMTIKERGDLVIELNLKEAPKTSENFLNLVKQGFYDGIRFHRVEPGFVVQAGDPQSRTLPMGHPLLGTGGSGKRIKFEPNNLKHVRGAVGMARAQDPDSASSQFYICLDDLPQLDGDYVVFGKVVEGIELIDKIQLGDTIEKAVVLERWEPKKPRDSAASEAKPSDGR